jgi:5-methylcytosine-specific restriction endonuclease McrA
MTRRVYDDLCGNGDEPDDLANVETPFVNQRLSWDVRKQGRTDEIRRLKQLPYWQYLFSPHWEATRRRALQRMPQCQLCEAERRLDVHHLTYQRLGWEKESDLIVLCSRCHEWVHANPHRETVLRWMEPARARNVLQDDDNAASWARWFEPQADA